jgi:hypothetical protein
LSIAKSRPAPNIGPQLGEHQIANLLFSGITCIFSLLVRLNRKACGSFFHLENESQSVVVKPPNINLDSLAFKSVNVCDLPSHFAWKLCAPNFYCRIWLKFW